MILMYEVTGSSKKWIAQLLGSNGVLRTLEATSEKQAHFLAQREWPEAIGPRAYNKLKDAEYYSAEGRAHRRKMENKPK